MATKKEPKTLNLPLADIKAYKVMEIICFRGVTYEGKKYTVWMHPEGGVEELELEAVTK